MSLINRENIELKLLKQRIQQIPNFNLAFHADSYMPSILQAYNY